MIDNVGQKTENNLKCVIITASQPNTLTECRKGEYLIPSGSKEPSKRRAEFQNTAPLKDATSVPDYVLM